MSLTPPQTGKAALSKGPVRIIEVGPRDGLQNEPNVLPIEAKVAFINALSRTGVAEIEAGSFVSASAVPQLADSDDVFRKIERAPLRDILRRLIDAGLGSLPGGGAEIFHPEVREEICGAKASTEAWLEVHRTAHELGLHSNATMLYGHIERPEHRIDHLIRLRDLQDQTGGFQTFIPLAFHPDNSRMSDIPKPSGVMDLKTMAISRLMLDNFPHIKAYWIMLGIKTAQVALSFGGDDLDGTVVHETIYHEAGAETPQEMTIAEIRRLIEEAGRIPVERDTLYHRIERDGARWRPGDHIEVPALAGVAR